MGTSVLLTISSILHRISESDKNSLQNYWVTKINVMGHNCANFLS